MRWPAMFSLVAAVIALSGCAASFSGEPPKQVWSTGFWYWQRFSDVAPPGPPVDVIFFQAGTINRELYLQRPSEWNAYANIPRSLPSAREYWAVFRYERQGLPEGAAPVVAKEMAEVVKNARRQSLNLKGVQLDIDCPTGSLSKYAAWLRELKQGLPKGTEVSITALLDWFRDGTDVAEAIREVDEFVPQFYDVDWRDRSGRSAIGIRVDADRWGSVFNRFRKRFRIGVSTFGRARLLPATASSPSIPLLGIDSYFNDLTPIDFAVNPAFTLQATRNKASELVLDYRANRKIEMSYIHFQPGDAVEFIFATPEAIRGAGDAIRAMKGYCAGVVFFRWSSEHDPLTMLPDEVLENAGLLGLREPKMASVLLINGGCAAVACNDIYLESPAPFGAKAIDYRVHSSQELEYFLPEKRMPVRMAGPSDLEVSLPPYCARGRLYLGRVVTKRRADFTVEELQ